MKTVFLWSNTRRWPDGWGGGTYYEELRDYEKIWGEIQNTGDTWARVKDMNINYYDERGYLLKQYTIHPLIEWLSPGQKSPFYKDELPYGTYDKYTFELECGLASPHWSQKECEQLEILSLKGGPAFEVEVHNAGDTDVSGITLLATFYDSQGRVVGMSRAGNSCTLSNQARTFTMFTTIEQASEFSDYSLQCCEYSQWMNIAYFS